MKCHAATSPDLQVPFESLRRAAKDRKHVVTEVEASLDEVCNAYSAAKAPVKGPVYLPDINQAGPSKRDAESTLDRACAQLQDLKRKLVALGACEKADAHRTHARLKHLQQLGAPQQERMLAWQRQRLDIILVDHFLRSGLYDTAAELAKDSKVEDLVDTHILRDAREVVTALQQHDCGPALQWCQQQAQRLKKIKSKLEFKLRIQEFVELVRAGKMLEAITYARQHLAQWAGSHMQELQTVVALLAFRAETECKPYQELFQPDRWDALITLFYRELYKLNNLTPQSLLNIHLQASACPDHCSNAWLAGLSALKTPNNQAGDSSKQDPMHLQSFQQLADGLPYAKHVHSKLMCSITHELMTGQTHPVMLPNGNVYSQRGIEQVAAANNGRIVDPLSGKPISCCPPVQTLCTGPAGPLHGLSCAGQVYSMSELRRVYIS
eukprot:jgi/Astpho2/2826/e_gw1.00050.131.1_t